MVWGFLNQDSLTSLIFHNTPRVRVTSYDADTDEVVVFYYAKDYLAAACDFFATALSPAWSQQSNVPTAGEKIVSPKTALHKLTWRNTKGEEIHAEDDEGIPTVLFDNSPREVYNLLSYVNSVKMQMEGDPWWHFTQEEVEPLLHLVCMIGYTDLIQKCEEYLHEKLSWDPIRVLELAETYRLEGLYTAACAAVLADYRAYRSVNTRKASKQTRLKLSRHRDAFFQQVALVTMTNLFQRCEHLCPNCNYGTDETLKDILRLAMRTVPGSSLALLIVLKANAHDPTDAEKLANLDMDGITLSGDQPLPSVDDDAPEEMPHLLTWAVNKVIPGEQAEELRSKISSLLFQLFSDGFEVDRW